MSTTALRLRTDASIGQKYLGFFIFVDVECFAKHDIVMLIASETSLKTANILKLYIP
ncbi:MAG: hypothetical protein KME50_16465 [Nostoc desertorum CM1-VF14]|nr:hypothetical protein [Nostoc desertorum CM1-VF14]